MKRFTKLQTAKFVPVSELFKGIPKLWNAWLDGDLPFTFGDANRSLINPERVVDSLESDGFDTNEEFKKEWAIFEKRMLTLMHPKGYLDPNIYIDMEN
jgi:hypothetical protein